MKESELGPNGSSLLSPGSLGLYTLKLIFKLVERPGHIGNIH